MVLFHCTAERSVLDSGYYLGGRFAGNNVNSSYYLIAPAAHNYPHLQLVAVDPLSPLLKGVTSFDGGEHSFRARGFFTPVAHAVATWSDQTPLIATGTVGKASARRVDLNFFPPSSDAYSGLWNSSTDGAKIMANAFTWVTGG